MDKILRAALYIRVSTAEQAMHGKSLQAQRECLESYAAANNMVVVGLYADEGQTARKELKKRKEIHRLIKDVEAKEQLIPTALNLLNDAQRLEALHTHVLALAENNSANRIAEEVMKLVK